MTMKAEACTGLAIADQIYAMIRSVSGEITAENRETARQAAEHQLEMGLKEAQELREAADDLRTGAFVSAAVTMVSAGAQLSLAAASTAKLSAVPKDASNQQVEAFRDGARVRDAWSQAARTAGEAAAPAQSYFEGNAKRHEADARAAAARGSADGRIADAANEASRAAGETERAARQHLQEIREQHHSAIMVALQIGKRA